MHHHPDPAELDSYLLGKSQKHVADSVIEHLLTCEQCMTVAKLHRDYLEAERRAAKNKGTSADLATLAALTTTGRPAGVEFVPGGHYAWALLVPLSIAVGLMSGSNAYQHNSLVMAARTAPSYLSRMVVEAPPDLPAISEGVIAEAAADESPAPVITVRGHKRNDETPANTVVAKSFVPPTRPKRAVSAEHVVLLPPVNDDRILLARVEFDDSPAVSLVSTEVSLAPPPRRPAKFKRFLSALTAPFRGS